MVSNIRSEEVLLINGFSAVVNYNSDGVIVGCLIVPKSYSEAYCLNEDINSFWSVGNRIIVSIKNNKITIIDILADKLEDRLLAYECEYRRVEDGYIFTRVLKDGKNIEIFCPNKPGDQSFLSAETLLELLNLGLKNILKFGHWSGCTSPKIGLITDETTAIYYPESGILKSGEQSPLNGNTIIGDGCFGSNNIFLTYCPSEQAYYVASFYFLEERFLFRGPLDAFWWSYMEQDCDNVPPIQRIRPVGFAFLKQPDNMSLISVFAVNKSRSDLNAQNLFNDHFFNYKGINLSSVRSLYNINGKTYNTTGSCRDFEAYFLGERENDDKLELFRVKNLFGLWNCPNKKTKFEMIIKSGAICRDYRLDSFCQYSCGSNDEKAGSIDFCSLIYVDKGEQLRMQLIINSESIANAWEDFASNNGKIFDEIFVSDLYIALRGSGGLVVYGAKNGSKLKTFSKDTKIYQLPDGNFEFEELDGVIYRFGAMPGSVFGSYTSNSTTWRKNLSLCYTEIWKEKRICYQATYNNGDVVCHPYFWDFKCGCANVEAGLRQSYQRNMKNSFWTPRNLS